MRLGRVLLIARREWTEVVANRIMLLSLAVIPIFLVLAPLPVIASMLPDASVPRETVDRVAVVVTSVVQLWTGLFLLLPVMVPLAIGAQSVVGEREKRTIEPLLVAPIEASEILVGKIVSALVPGLGITWLAFASFCGAVNLLAWPHFHRLLRPDLNGLLLLFLVGPVLAGLGNGLVVTVSARVSDARTSNQLSGLLIMPLMGFVAVPEMFGPELGPRVYLAAFVGIGLLDLAVYRLALRLFDRERLISTVR